MTFWYSIHLLYLIAKMAKTAKMVKNGQKWPIWLKMIRNMPKITESTGQAVKIPWPFPKGKVGEGER